jgi:hypothetical protein
MAFMMGETDGRGGPPCFSGSLPGGGDSIGYSANIPFSFQFKPGRTAELVILMDQDTDGEDDLEDEEDAGDDEMMAEMMKPYFSTMSFLVKVVFDGEIRETNAFYREGNSITLLDIDMGKIIDNDEPFSGLMESGSEQDEEMIDALEAAGIRIETWADFGPGPRLFCAAYFVPPPVPVSP